MVEKRLRVALSGRFCSEDAGSNEAQKEELRKEARRRNYIIVDEFWEEDSSLDASLEERPEMKRFIQSVWANDLNIDALFLHDITSLGWTSRREQVTLTMLFELNDIVLITLDEIYDPNDWMAGLSF
jgi:DNA invertase Pin-like site-specific DNA recombinase